MAQSNELKRRVSKFHDFHEVLENVAWLWRTLGIFPITIKTQNYKKKYEVSMFYAAIGCLSCFIFIADFIYVTIEFRTASRYVTLLTYLTSSISSITNLLCTSFNNMWKIIKIKELSKSVNELSVQEAMLNKLNCLINHDSSSKIIRMYVWTTFFATLYFIIFDTCVTAQFYGFRMQWFIWQVGILITNMDITILVSLVGWLGLKFRSINNKINDIAKRANTSSPKIIETLDVCAENLRILSKFHYDVCEIGKRINRYFYISIIVHVTAAFIILSTTLYSIFDQVRREERANIRFILTYIHWELCYSAPIITIVIICNWTSNQAMYAGELIHEIRVTKADTQLYEVIKSFSLQLHHQKLEFTGGGLFPLDSSLLQTMAGKITTYLVILIQFQPRVDWQPGDD